ncbi:HD domain-containing phosphohydrolase [Cetobacterium sp.]|uniref:HD domain-containing phosphohydrolase n=1 Tax=Cetobacterium sp. TaxID=2071632 RepID=UPI003F3EA9C2
MKKVILLLLLFTNSIIFSKSNIVATSPSNSTDMYLYKNLEEGEYRGVYVDLLKGGLINEKVEIKLEAKNSEILLRTIKTADGLKSYNYIDTPMIYRVGVILNKDSSLTNLGEVKKIKVAYISGQHGLNELNERYTELQIDKTEVKNIDEGLEKLKKMEVEAFIVQDWYDKNSGDTEYKILENIKYNEQIAVLKNKEALYEEVKNKVESLKGEEFQKLLSKNRVEFYKYLLKESPSYKNVSKNYKEIKVKIGKDKFMLPFYYEHRKGYEGLTINIVKELQKIIEIPFVFVKEGEYDIEGIAIENYLGKATKNYTKPYYEMKLSVANRKSDGFVQNISDLNKTKILVLKGDYSYTYLKRILKNSEIIEVETYEEGLRKLLNQEGEYLVGYFNILTGVISNNFLDDKIKVAGILNDSFGVSFGIPKEKQELSNLLEKILESFTVDKTVIDNDLLKNSIVTQNYKLILKISIPLVLFILILIFLIIKAEKNRKKAEELSFSLIEVLEMANQLNDEDTGDHVKRLGMYSTLLSEKANLPKEIKESIQRFSSLHDIGKVAIPSEILKKPSKLTEEEFKKVKEHVNIGYSLVKKLKLGSVAENIVRYHHEKWDGSGYPLGLQGEAIPLEARIVSIVDVYDALRQKKFHREALSHKDAMELMSKDQGVSFDPRLFQIFLNNDKEFEVIYEENKESLGLATEFYSAIYKQ